MANLKVFVTRKMAQEAIDMLKTEGYQVEVWCDEMPPPREVMLEKARECDALLTLVTDKIDDELMGNAPNLKVVANMAVGFDNFDVAAATKRGIPMSNTPEVLTKTTADLNLGPSAGSGTSRGRGRPPCSTEQVEDVASTFLYGSGCV